MGNESKDIKAAGFFNTVFIISVLLFPAFASSQENYRFERMWPALKQPWYFNGASGIAVDSSGFVYIANYDNKIARIQKFTTEGKLVGTFGSRGSGDGQFYEPKGIAIDSNGFVYVTDYSVYNFPIQKFTSDGQFVKEWGGLGTGDGQFDRPEGIAIDSSGFVYVADEYNNRIQKFTSEGIFITKWGSQGTGDGQFNRPHGIAIDSSGFVYVADTYNSRIQKFTPEGDFITKWVRGGSAGDFTNPSGIAIDSSGFVYVAKYGGIIKYTSDGQFVKEWGWTGTGDGQFYWPEGIAVDSSGFVYVSEDRDRIQKFTLEGEFVSKWVGWGTGDGQFDRPTGIAIDSSSFVYVADPNNDRIQKFTPEGQFVKKWGSYGTGDGQFDEPNDIAVDSSGFVYVTDTYNSRIQKFTPEGQFVKKWGSYGTGDGQFGWPVGIAIDSSGFVYVAEYYVDELLNFTSRIQKFTSEGVFVKKWGSWGYGDGQFNWPYGIAVDSSGFVYVADTVNSRIQKFTSEGVFVKKWGSWCRMDDGWGCIDPDGAGPLVLGDGQFDEPNDIAVDSSGFVYVTDSSNERIQKFSSEGQFISKWGGLGSNPGLFNNPLYLDISATDNIYVSDVANRRIQVFKKVTVADDFKAIIVAGRTSSLDSLWDATQMCSNFAYRTLIYQGFTNESVYYLTSDTDLDLDSNGLLDEVDDIPTNANLHYALTTWAADTDNLIVCVTDHGGAGTFRLNETETLSVSNLASWLNTVQQVIPGIVVVIYDACESGSFLSQLDPPAGKDRIVITSTALLESAYFITQGTISFSNYFWTHIFNGLSVYDAYDLAREAMAYTTPYQHPLLDDGHNGTLAAVTYIGNGTPLAEEAPVIGEVSGDQTIVGTSSALLYADNVTDKDGIARVWGVIRPPDYNQGSPDNPVQELPKVEFLPAGENRYEVTYNAFNIPGTYLISIYARDRAGDTSISEITTVNVNNPLTRKAVIVAGDTEDTDLWQAIERNTQFSFDTLRFQGYRDEDIYFLSPDYPEGDADALTTLANVTDAFGDWAEQDTQDVVLYLIGEGDYGSFKLNATETLSASYLDSLLDTLQGNIPGKITVIYDGCKAGGFLSYLIPPPGKERILATSTGPYQPAYFLSGGNISFSHFFWAKVLDGSNIRDAFNHAVDAIQYVCRNQTPLLEGNGNGVGNESGDRTMAYHHTIGLGIMLAGNAPIIGSASLEQSQQGETSALIVAKNVTSTGTIARVWAVITPPGYSPNPDNPVTAIPSLDLLSVGGGRYEGTYGFLTDGTYQVAVYAVDDEGTVSMPKEVEMYGGGDGVPDEGDNCPSIPNGLSLGVCVKAIGGVFVGTDTICTSDGDCSAIGGTCDMAQGDYNTNGIGDACECYADCNCDTKVNLSDLVIMRQEFLKTPQYADCNGDAKVDLQDLVIMKTQFLQTGCPACPV